MGKWTIEQQLQAIKNRREEALKKERELKKRLQIEQDKVNAVIGRLVLKHYKQGSKLEEDFYTELDKLLTPKKDNKQDTTKEDSNDNPLKDMTDFLND